MVEFLATSILMNFIDIGAKVAQIVIASINLGLAYYIFVYQRRKDFNSHRTTISLHESNIKLQWFKELVVQPKKHLIDEFFNNLKKIRDKIDKNDLEETRKIEINNFLKSEAQIFRKEFIDFLFLIDANLGAELQRIIDDDLVDKITTAIFNEDLKLNNDRVYNKEIGDLIDKAHHKFISSIYHYHGTSVPMPSPSVT
ncbi:MAG TPA: hypothetical protein PKD91_02000 [Bacteroidia bacterium]|nr:hypothetical protein [Bacteroidia bacterium]